MRKPVALRLSAALGTLALAAATGVVLSMPTASAASAGATGFATQNGGTTGGAGGTTVRAATGTQIHQALCSRASSSTPIVIQVEGTVTVGNTAKVSGGSCNTAAGVIELKGVSNVTLVGVGAGAVFDQIGIHLRQSSNIIVQNVTVQNVKKSGSPTSNGGDAIGMESDVHNVWVDHATLTASGGESAGYDALFDMKANTRYVTLSYSVLRNSGRGGLVGSSDSDLGNGPVTFHHNRYENIDSRTPLLRGATAHIYNNYYVSLNESGINPRAGGKAKVDNNYFKNSKDVLGTFYTDLPGYWQVSGNVFDNVTWTQPGEDNNPAGPNPTSNTTVSIPYSYSLDAASCVPSIVTATAGAGTGLKVSDGNCVATTPTATATADPTPTGTPTPTATSTPAGVNLSLAAAASADGSGKASGTSYGNVRDGDTGTYWSPAGSTGSISIKWGSATAISKVTLREAAGASGNIGSWRVLDGDTGAVLASGSGASAISFASTSLKKVTFEITGSSATPKVAEFETYA
ncbi:pectate lyase [Streptomyces sp. AK04-3B]|uniref:pectate lyase family protein n=1 Tax=Streptomyces sp. AK04-3B TaxID=3028650 RepID=UPI0029A4CDCA|nr:pectate lyase [Streptomyces sp. AK04-3B]MDX3801598.1 pectate lyase [Streptomyces sp. AK04-3B]